MNLTSPTVQRWIDEGRDDPEGFWARAAQQIPWFRTWDRVFEPDLPSFRWFVGARTNLAYNAVDRHVDAGEGGRAALVYLNERADPRWDCSHDRRRNPHRGFGAPWRWPVHQARRLTGGSTGAGAPRASSRAQPRAHAQASGQSG